jgi:hypothetical protein
MANAQSWQDRDKILAILNSMDIYLKSYKTTFESLKAMKIEVLDNPERYAELRKIILEDPIYTMQGLADKYLFYKEIYDWLKANGKI